MSDGTDVFIHMYQIDEIADLIERYINNNNRVDQGPGDRVDLDEWGDPIGRGYKAQTIREFREAVKLLRRVKVYANRIDCLLASVDCEDNFHRRLRDDLSKLGEGQNNGNV